VDTPGNIADLREILVEQPLAFDGINGRSFR